MEHVNHLPFIVGSYVAACAIIGVLAGWIALDYRTQKRALADLETRGVTRRSAGARGEPAMQQAKGPA